MWNLAGTISKPTRLLTTSSKGHPEAYEWWIRCVPGNPREIPKHGYRTYIGHSQKEWLRRALALYVVIMIVTFYIGWYTVTTADDKEVVQGKVWEMPKRKLITL